MKNREIQTKQLARLPRRVLRMEKQSKFYIYKPARPFARPVRSHIVTLKIICIKSGFREYLSINYSIVLLKVH